MFKNCLFWEDMGGLGGGYRGPYPLSSTNDSPPPRRRQNGISGTHLSLIPSNYYSFFYLVKIFEFW